MLSSMIELNQKEIDLISGGENENEPVTIDGGNNAPAQQSSYSEMALEAASAMGRYAWYAGKVALALTGTAVATLLVTITVPTFVKNRLLINRLGNGNQGSSEKIVIN